MTKTPRPGAPVRGSRSGVPVMALFDLLGRSWSLGILWTLHDRGPCTFRELRLYCEMISPTVLNTRLKELRESGLIDHGADGYEVTSLGSELHQHLVPMKQWAVRWARHLREQDRQ